MCFGVFGNNPEWNLVFFFSLVKLKIIIKKFIKTKPKKSHLIERFLSGFPCLAYEEYREYMKEK